MAKMRVRAVLLTLVAVFALSAVGSPAVFAANTPVQTTSIPPAPDAVKWTRDFLTQYPAFKVEIDGLASAGVLIPFAQFYIAHPAAAITFLGLLGSHPIILAWIQGNPQTAAALFLWLAGLSDSLVSAVVASLASFFAA
jgi:hypothetical protein